MYNDIGTNKVTPFPSDQHCIECADDDHNNKAQSSQHDMKNNVINQNASPQTNNNDLTSMLLSRILPEINDNYEIDSLRKIIQEQIEQVHLIQDNINKERERRLFLETKFSILKKKMDHRSSSCCQSKEPTNVTSNNKKILSSATITKIKNDDGVSINEKRPNKSSYADKRKLIKKEDKSKRSKNKLVYSAQKSKKRTSMVFHKVTIGEKKKKQKGLTHFFTPAVKK